MELTKQQAKIMEEALEAAEDETMEQSQEEDPAEDDKECPARAAGRTTWWMCAKCKHRASKQKLFCRPFCRSKPKGTHIFGRGKAQADDKAGTKGKKKKDNKEDREAEKAKHESGDAPTTSNDESSGSSSTSYRDALEFRKAAIRKARKELNRTLMFMSNDGCSDTEGDPSLELGANFQLRFGALARFEEVNM